MASPSSRADGAPALTRVRRSLQAWYAADHRDFPWRRTRDPWAILVSEVMLQQTQASRVAERFPPFVARFPTPAAMAAASEAEVLVAWSGLGYNRRVLALRRTAAEVAAHGWPHDPPDLERLPGIGPYTARAVASLAFGKPVGVVDTNVRRWLVRRFGLPPHAGVAALQALADRLARSTNVAEGAPETAAWTHATMEFGARVCTSCAPRCDTCPLARGCPSRDIAAPVPVPRQGTFEGSGRAARGAILRRLVAEPRRSLTLAAARRAVPGIGHTAFERIVLGLEHDRLIHRSGGRVHLGGRVAADVAATIGVMSTATAALQVQIGDQTPSVGLRATDGYLLNLRSFVGKKPATIVFFAGPSLTGASRQRGDELALALKEAYPRLERNGVGLIAVTTDDERQQAAYVQELELPYLLHCDERLIAVNLLGIPTTSVRGNVNAEPTAFAVSIDGTILDIVEHATPKGLVARLLEAIFPPS